MWYAQVAFVLFIMFFLICSYKFIFDKSPFDKRYAGDLEHFFWINLLAIPFVCMWPASIPIFFVGWLREFVKKRRERKVG